MKKIVCIILVAAFILSGCGVNKVLISEQATGPKNLFINLSNDPELISIELKTILMSKGYSVALSTEESGRGGN